MYIKILLIIFILLIITRVVDRYKKRDLRKSELVAWLIFWIAAAGFVAWPDASSLLAFKLGVGRGVDLMVYLAIMLVFYLVFRLFVRLEHMERDMTQLVKEIALKEGDKEEKKSDT